MTEAADYLAPVQQEHARHLARIAGGEADPMFADEGGVQAAPPDAWTRQLPHGPLLETEASIQRSIGVMNSVERSKSVALERVVHRLGVAKIDEHDARAGLLNGLAAGSQIRHRLPAEGASGVAKENEEDWRDERQRRQIYAFPGKLGIEHLG